MDLFFKKPAKETRRAMCNASLRMKHDPHGRNEETVIAEEIIRTITRHEHAKIVNSGESAILSVMSTLKGSILIPDQGGWIGFKKMAKFLGLKAIEVPTQLGIISPDILSDFMDKNNPEALFITSFAGYTAEQPLKEINRVCEDQGVLLVEDASGAVGDDTGKLANGHHSPVIVASTGSPKIINVGCGGFISTNDEKILDDAKDILKAVRADAMICAGMVEEIRKAPYVLSQTIAACQFLKKPLENALHPHKRGINVTLSTQNPKKLGYELRRKLKVHGGGMVTLCPLYNRLMTKAVCIEIKNLDIRCLSNRNLDTILQVIAEIPSI